LFYDADSVLKRNFMKTALIQQSYYGNKERTIEVTTDKSFIKMNIFVKVKIQSFLIMLPILNLMYCFGVVLPKNIMWY